MKKSTVRSYFIYLDGLLLWNRRVDNSKANAKFNLNHYGKEAGYIRKFTDGREYKVINIKRKTYFVHRLVYNYFYGCVAGEIDHIDGDTLNNNIENLRDVSHMENCKNKRTHSNNTSGVSGVHFAKHVGKWVARISDKDGKRRHLGLFKDKREAVAARLAAEKDFGYHENHGR